MNLLRVSKFWGEHNYFRSAPRVQRATDIIYRPLSPDIWPDEDPGWGIYGRDGTQIDLTAYRRGAARVLVGQSVHSVASLPAASAPDVEHIYCGPILPHFGHFLATSIARLWYAGDAARRYGAKLLFHASHAPASWFAYPYAAAIFAALGITVEDCAWYPEPVRIQSLTIPQASFVEQYGVHDAFHACAAAIGAAMRGTAAADCSPVWLSKARMSSGVGRFVDEPEMQEIMAAEGIRIVYPEELSFAEQIALFSGDGVVLGTLGSAFHTHVFAPSDKRIICLCPANLLNSNYKLFDSRQRNAAYVYAGDDVQKLDNCDGFISQYILKNPRAVAKSLLHMAQI